MNRSTSIALLMLSAVPAMAQHPYADSARAQARRLLVFHFGDDDRIEIDRDVKQLQSIKNPAGGKYRLQVLEVWAYIYKGQYRVRLYYLKLEGDYILMGQEILEFARL